MHASIDQLLDIADSAKEADGAEELAGSVIAQHVSECQQCQSALAELRALKSTVSLAMFDAADQVPSDLAWRRIQQSLKVQSELIETEHVSFEHNNVVSLEASGVVRNTQASLTKAIYALAASIAFVGVITVFTFSNQQSNSQQTLAMQSTINELMLNSRGLEQVLQQVANQNEALSVANQTTADRLYWRLTQVDQLINQVSPDNPERIEVLWNDRIEALNQLNQIYYQHEGTLDAPEI